MFRIGPIDHVALTVNDVERSVIWFREVLGLERRHAETWSDFPAMMCSGDMCVALFPGSGAAPPPDVRRSTGMRHLAFE